MAKLAAREMQRAHGGTMGVQGLTGACEAGFLHPREQETNPQAKSRPAEHRSCTSRCRPARQLACVHLPARFAFKAASAAGSQASVPCSILSCRTMDMSGGTATDAATAASTASPSLPSSARCFRPTTSGRGARKPQTRASFPCMHVVLVRQEEPLGDDRENRRRARPVTRLPDHRTKL
jgi:hypothetical protein